jgi:septum formation protein
MLEAAGIPFETMPAEVDEEAVKAELSGLTPIALAAALAERKALSIVIPGLVLGADQILELEDGSKLDKPRSRDDAMAQIQSLGGRTHYLRSAAAIVEDRAIKWRCTESVKLRMRPLSDQFLRDYLDAEYEAIRWSVGGYRIEGPGVQLFERIEGSHFAILGLPLLPLLAYLRTRGIVPS